MPRATVTLSAYAIGAALAAGPARAQAPIVTDGTMGARAELNGPAMQIPHTLGTQAGPNLFHSFQRFNIPTQNSATFTGPGGINNVISRVTGGEASTINGAFRSTIPGANVWFTNPAGVTFGPNASLDVPASFHASTANEIRFPDGGRFSADLGATSTLSVAPPEAFGFLSSNPAPLRVEKSQLSVGTDATLSLAAGGIDIQGNAPTPDFTSPKFLNESTLRAPSGTINLASVGGPAEVKTDGTVSGNNHGAIRLTNGALIMANGDGGGAVRIRGGELTATGSYIIASNTGSATGAGGIDISADRFSLQGDPRSPSLVAANALSSGTAVPIDIRAQDIAMENGSAISSSANQNGSAVRVNIEADNISLGNKTSILSMTFGEGNAGTVMIKANTLTIGPGAEINTAASFDTSGKAGDVSIAANNFTLGSDAQIITTTFGAGNAGMVSVRSNEFTLGPDAKITTTSSFETNGSAGDVSIAANNFTLGHNAWIFSSSFGNGNAGDVSMAANNFTLGPGSAIYSDTFEKGTGGAVIIRANNLTIGPDARITTSTHGSGHAGQVTVRATGTVRVDDSFIGSDAIGLGASLSSGNAGEVSVTANDLTLTGPTAFISSDTHGSGNAGTVSVHANNFTLTGPTAFISSDTHGSGNAGTVSVHANNLTLTGAQIDSSTLGSGNAGRVTVQASTGTVRVDDSIIGSSSLGGGAPGDVEIYADALLLGPNGIIHAATLEPSSLVKDVNKTGSILVVANSIILSGDDGAGAGILASTSNARKAGSITVKAPLVILGPNTGIHSSTLSSGDAGAVQIEANNLTLKGPNANITSGSFGSGEAGKISLTGVSRLFMSDGARVTTRSGSAGGGNIAISGPGIIVLRDGSRIGVDVAEGTAQAGDITIGSRFLVLDRSTISATAHEGLGGNIRIVADHIFRSPESVIDASSALGLSGTVNISSPDTDVTGELAQLPGAVMNTTDQMQERCAVRGLVEGSSFTIAGLEALSPTLEGYLPGTYARVADEDTAVTDGSLMVASGGGLAFPVWTVACGDAR